MAGSESFHVTWFEFYEGWVLAMVNQPSNIRSSVNRKTCVFGINGLKKPLSWPSADGIASTSDD